MGDGDQRSGESKRVPQERAPQGEVVALLQRDETVRGLQANAFSGGETASDAVYDTVGQGVEVVGRTWHGSSFLGRFDKGLRDD
jgi:hypothetical protein